MECTHPMLYKNMCAACGAKVITNGDLEVDYAANFAASGGREVRITTEEASRIEKANISALHSMRKLSLVLDIDNTLLNATASTGYSEEKMEGCRELTMYDNGRSAKYFIKLRPKLQYFLEELSPLYQMSIYTHGTRKYAEGTCKIMDPEGVYFGKRIVSRSDHPELGANKSLTRLLKTDWSMVLIYDDREDVWKGEQRDHLLCAKPFVHFDQRGKGGAVNNAPGLLTLDRNGSAATAESPCTSNKEEEGGGLIQAVVIFKKLHHQYFATASEGKEACIGRVLEVMRRGLLMGCVVCFSGIIPSADPNPQEHPLWRIATRLGAEVQAMVTENTTHLLAAGLSGSSKIRQCLLRDDVFVLHCDWLLHCHWNLLHEDEEAYSLSAEHRPSLVRDKVSIRIKEIVNKTSTEVGVTPRVLCSDSEPATKKSRLMAAAGSESREESEGGNSDIPSSDDDDDDDEWLRELESNVACTEAETLHFISEEEVHLP